MSEIIIYHNGECSKSRGALELLQEENIPHSVRYYLMEPLSEEELKALLTKLGMRPQELVRTSEELYQREYTDKDLTDEEWLKILVENPSLIERPVVEYGEKAVVARPAERVLQLLSL